MIPTPDEFKSINIHLLFARQTITSRNYMSVQHFSKCKRTSHQFSLSPTSFIPLTISMSIVRGNSSIAKYKDSYNNISRNVSGPSITGGNWPSGRGGVETQGSEGRGPASEQNGHAPRGKRPSGWAWPAAQINPVGVSGKPAVC